MRLLNVENCRPIRECFGGTGRPADHQILIPNTRLRVLLLVVAGASLEKMPKAPPF